MERKNPNDHAGYYYYPLLEEGEAEAVLDRFRAVRAQTRLMAPDFTLKAAQGGTTRLSDLRDRAVILTFFTPHGWTSRAQISALNQVAHYRVATILGIAEAGYDDLCGLAVEKRTRFLLLMDPNSQIAKRYGAMDLPATYCIDAQGRIAASQHSLVPATTLLEWLAWL